MLTKTIEVNESQTRLAELLSVVLGGTEIILTQDQIPVVRLTPIAAPPAAPRTAGLHKGAIWASDDFAEPLPEEFWTEGK